MKRKCFTSCFLQDITQNIKTAKELSWFSRLEITSPPPKFPLGKREAFSAPNTGLVSATTLQIAQSFSRSVESPNLKDALPESTDKTVIATSRLSVRFSLCPGFLISNPHDFHPVPGMFPQVYFPYLNPRSSLTDNL